MAGKGTAPPQGVLLPSDCAALQGGCFAHQYSCSPGHWMGTSAPSADSTFFGEFLALKFGFINRLGKMSWSL